MNMKETRTGAGGELEEAALVAANDAVHGAEFVRVLELHAAGARLVERLLEERLLAVSDQRRRLEPVDELRERRGRLERQRVGLLAQVERSGVQETRRVQRRVRLVEIHRLGREREQQVHAGQRAGAHPHVILREREQRRAVRPVEQFDQNVHAAAQRAHRREVLGAHEKPMLRERLAIERLARANNTCRRTRRTNIRIQYIKTQENVSVAQVLCSSLQYSYD